MSRSSCLVPLRAAARRGFLGAALAERARLNRVLAEVQTRRMNLIVVVNEYGGTAGIITKEDLVEEIVGEIFDEQEREEAPEVESLPDGTWRVAGLLSVDDLVELTGRMT